MKKYFVIGLVVTCLISGGLFVYSKVNDSKLDKTKITQNISPDFDKLSSKKQVNQEDLSKKMLGEWTDADQDKLHQIMKRAEKDIPLKKITKQEAVEELIVLLRRTDVDFDFKVAIFDRIANDFPAVDISTQGLAKKQKFYDKYSNINYEKAVISVEQSTDKENSSQLRRVTVSNVSDFDGKKLPNIFWDIGIDNKIMVNLQISNDPNSKYYVPIEKQQEFQYKL